ncbi:Uncharacterised protein [uncultured archaeon]|nr:Uncharacterised protein [uncultured archaeon]
MIIGLMGWTGSGKDTVSDYLVQKYGFKKLGFADSLKEAISSVFDWPLDMLQGSTKESRVWREKIDPWWAKRLGISNLTPRYILQKWGTDVCRRYFNDDIWIASLERKLRISVQNIVIDDCRFSNEVAMIRQNKGILWRITRGKYPIWYETALYEIQHGGKEMEEKFPDVHISEWGWIGEKFEAEIFNNKTKDNLYRQVDYLMAQNGIAVENF